MVDQLLDLRELKVDAGLTQGRWKYGSDDSGGTLGRGADRQCMDLVTVARASRRGGSVHGARRGGGLFMPSAAGGGELATSGLPAPVSPRRPGDAAAAAAVDPGDAQPCVADAPVPEYDDDSCQWGDGRRGGRGVWPA